MVTGPDRSTRTACSVMAVRPRRRARWPSCPSRGTASSRPHPRPAQPRRAQIPVRAGLARHGAQVVPEVVEGRAAPEPVAVVDAVDDQSRLEHERVRDHRVVVRIGVLGDVEVLLDCSAGVGQERPRGADRRAELLQRVVLVGGDRDDLGIGHRDLRVVGGQLQVLLMLLRTVVTAGEREDQRIAALELTERADGAGVIGQRVIGKAGAGDDVGTHGMIASQGCLRPVLRTGNRAVVAAAPDSARLYRPT